MVEVRYRPVSATRAAELRIQGHAGAGRPGEDLVCAAVSALAETLRIAFQGKGGGGVSVYVGPGDARFEMGAEAGPEARVALETIVGGLEDLARSHRRFVRFTVERSGKEG